MDHSFKIRIGVLSLVLCAFAFPANGHAATIKSASGSGLVGYWSFNEGTSTIAHDFSGMANNGTLGGSTKPAWASGKFGQALSFNGSSAYTSIPNSASLAPTGNKLTVSAWFKTSDKTANSRILSKTESGGYQLSLNENSGCTSNTLCILMNINSGYVQASYATSNLSNNVWYHVVGVYNGSSLTLYVNGVSVATTATSGNLTYTYANPLCIGSEASPTVCTIGNYFPGTIDEVRIYNRALTQAEVTGLYWAGLTVMNTSKVNDNTKATSLTSGLVGWWTMDGADIGTSIQDKSGNGFNGYLVGTNNATSSRKVSGKIGQAFAFGGQNTGGINVGSNAALTPSRFTITAWINPSRPQTAVYNYIFSNARDNCQTGLNGIDFKLYAAGSLSGIVCNNGTAYGTSVASGIATSTWAHVAYSYDGSNTRLYVNGILKATVAVTVDPGTPASYSTYIGTMGHANGATYTLNGAIDDVRLYNRALTSVEIAQLAAQGGGAALNSASQNRDNGSTVGSGLVGHWTFDGSKTQSTIADSSGSGNNGYFIGSATSSAKVAGKLGQALKFNGNGSYVNIPSATNFPSSSITVSAWVKLSVNKSYNNIINHRWTSVSGSWILYTNSLGTVGFGLYDSSQHTITKTGLVVGAWYHVVGVYDGSNMQIYVNGVAGTPVSLPGLSLDTSGATTISDGLGASSMNGVIDDVRMYSRALTATEVKQLYNVGR